VTLTYEIIGGDNRAHGPVTGEELCEWIRQGRAGRNTMIRPSNTDTWRPLSTFPEFSGPLRGLPWIPLYQPAPKAHKLAVTSMVLGISSLVLIAAAIFLVPVGMIVVAATAGRPQLAVFAAMVMVGLLILPSAASVITGHAGLRAIKAGPAEYGGGGMAVAGLVTGYLSLAASGILFVLVAWGWLETID